MILRGINFGPVLGASGVQNFFGEGYAFHKVTDPFKHLFNGIAFVSKTTTLKKRVGNMPLKKDGITPSELKPSCIKVKFRKGVVLNSVGLSGPGAIALLEDGRWQKRTKPFFISFMAVGVTAEDRIRELSNFVLLLQQYLSRFNALVGLQINYSCPNLGHHVDQDRLIYETKQGLSSASELNIPLTLKFNALTPVGIVKTISEHKSCDAICISNTIPWGELPNRIDWEGLFGSNVSPLAHLGGGGLSGVPLLPIVAEWVKQARDAGIRKHINAGGGILCPNGVDLLYGAGADSVSLGSIRILRWWRMKETIKRAYELF